MTLNQLRYFCMASRCHSITKAAEELYVTQRSGFHSGYGKTALDFL